MANNFLKGLDPADPTGQTGLPGYCFISKSGNDANPGTPEQPFLTNAPVDAGGFSNCIIGDGEYLFTGIQSTVNCLYEGENPSTVILRGVTGQNFFGASNQNRASLSSVTIEDQDIMIFSNNSGIPCAFVNCRLINCTINTASTNRSYVFIDSEFVDSQMTNTVVANNGRSVFRNSKAINSTVVLKEISPSNAGCINSVVDFNSSLICLDAGSLLSSRFCDVQGTITDEFGVTRNLADTIATYPAAFADSFNDNPGFASVASLNFSITTNSPLFQNGENTSNIGNSKVGSAFLQGSAILDDAVNANINVSYDATGQLILLPSAGTEETIETDWIELDQVQNLGAILPSGVIEFGQYVPDTNNSLVNPNNLILEINTRIQEGIEAGYKHFRWGLQPTVDNSGVGNGDPLVNKFQTNKIPCKAFRVRITILNIGVYNPA